MKKTKTHLNPRTSRRWRASGTDPENAKQRRDRLLEAKNVPEGALPAAPAATPAPDHGDAGGPTAQLVRLEADVQHLRGRLRDAAGDPVLERSLRRQLLAVEGELRKVHESGVTSPTGTEIPLAEAEDAIRAITYCLRIASRRVGDGLAEALTRGDTPHADDQVIANTIAANRLLLAARNLFNPDIPGLCCPPWALAVIEAELSNQFKGDELKTFLEGKK